ncbi:hypothetical protein [Streptomyces europaeiscabiei]|uniref:hypothetical protein n=1 Tax=Streptomyces europaeiscabiei TaxID=146819 RepID=UPI0029BD968D|nr:hypothetical protein [Streptomyces europaeiscabiei]MDX3617080.1 hypothetical protein [Streptomyces europaeiscabiei]
MKKRFAAVGITSAALFTTLVTAGPAQAVNVVAFCRTTGAVGDILVYGYDSARTDIILTISVTDTLGDDHHARVRLLTENHAGTVKKWPWRENTAGVQETKSWNTTASESSGIHEVGVEVARFEKNTRLNSCTDWG